MALGMILGIKSVDVQKKQCDGALLGIGGVLLKGSAALWDKS